MKNKQIIITIIVSLIVGAVGFFGGMKFDDYNLSKNRNSGMRQFQGGQFPNRQNGQGGGSRQGFRPVNGEIISVDDKSITVKMQDGSSRIVILSDKTTYSKSADGTKNDLKIGEKVAVFGTDNTDGSVIAQNIQLNPQFRGVISITPKP